MSSNLEQELLPPPRHNDDPNLSLVTQFVPWPRDDERSRYIGYLCSGFSVYESLHMVDRSKSALSFWRQDQTFVQAEGKVPEIRKTLSREYAELEFLRNFRLVMEKDKRVLQTSLDEPNKMSKNDVNYLLKLRSNYTPQQLQSLMAIFGLPENSNFDFSKWVKDNSEFVKMERTDSITMRRQMEHDSGSED